MNSEENDVLCRRLLPLHLGGTMNENSSQYESEISDTERYIEVCVLSVITVLAVVANISLWLVVLGTRSLRAESNNILLLSLSLADILVAVISMPITVVSIYMGRWIFSGQMCTVVGFLNLLTLVSSVMSLGLISINRYIKICRPHHYQAVYTKVKIFLMTLGVWCLSALLSSLPLFGWCSFVYRPKQSFCFCDWSSSVSYTFFMFLACFGGPLVMMALSNARILQTYHNSQRRLHQQSGQRLQLQPAGEQQQRQQSKVTSTAADASDKDKSVSPPASAGSSPDGAVVPASAEDASRLFVLAATPSSHPGERLTVAGGVAHHNGTAGRGSGDDAAGSERAKPAAAASASAPALVVAGASAAVTPRSEGVEQQQRPQPLQVVQSGPAGADSMVSLSTRPLFASVLAMKKSLTGASSMTDLSVRQKRKKKRRTEEFQLALSLMVVILVFVICWLPFCVTMFLSVFRPQSLPRAADMFTLLLGYTNSCINPFIYGVMNRRVKEGYRELWKKLCFYRLWRRQHKTAVMKTTTRCSDTQS